MIKVDKVKTENLDTATIIYCDYENGGSGDRLWYKVSEDWSEYLSSDCGDAFFVILVLLAHYQGQNISFTTPVSTRLYYGVTEILLPGLRVLNPKLPIITVTADTQDFSFNPVGVGTALSLGVDSFHAVASSFDTPYPVTHLTLFNSGAFGDYGGETSRALFHKTIESVNEAAIAMNLPLITIDSNISEVLNVSFVPTHSIRNLSFALLLPALFSHFYYASGYPVSKFKLDPSSIDATHYDLLIAKALCTESFEVMIAGLHDDRIDKVATIASFEPSTHYLNVCILADSNEFLDRSDTQVKNCSRCFKCVKTMVAMDALGVLDNYSEVFDLELYAAKRLEYLGWILYDAKKLKSTHAIETIQEGNKSSRFIPLQAYPYALSRGKRNLVSKLKRKIESK